MSDFALRKMHPEPFFTLTLLEWARTIHRPLPWKGERDAYKIWLSEILLQQTRAEQGLPYYLRFLERFPTLNSLATASEAEVLKHWEGLGYYARARNLHATAIFLVEKCGGRFPDTYEGLRALKGVGDYTAAAVASFAFGLPHAVVDGNVYRVLSRFFGIEMPVDTTEGKKTFAALANRLLDRKQPAAYNQALMDFGALQCTPAKPNCTACPLNEHCAALATGRIAELPVKAKKLEKKQRSFLYAVLYNKEGVWIRKREDRDIWRNLYEFPMVEINSEKQPSEAEICQLLFGNTYPSGLRFKQLSGPFHQTLTHQKISAFFAAFEVPKMAENALISADLMQKCLFSNHLDLKKIYPFPRLINWYWEQSPVSLTAFLK